LTFSSGERPRALWFVERKERKNLRSGSDGCRGGGSHLSLVVFVSEKLNLVSEKSGKGQGILLICGAGNPVYDLINSNMH